MFTEEFKNLIKNIGGRYIIVENGKPCYILMSWEEYKKAIIDRKPVEMLTEEELIDKINDDIALWRENQKKDGYINNDDSKDNVLLDEIEGLEDIEYV